MTQDGQHFDVVIVGAGLSGIGTACHLQMNCPSKSFVLLEARKDIGGTWDLFRYPGIRSDSDMHTLGYNFKPWKEAKAIADGPAILRYIKETVAENAIGQHIRLNHRVTKAAWSSRDAKWSITAEQIDNGEQVRFTAGFLMACAGYYSYRAGYCPDFPDRELFQGRIVHPQNWPEDLDYTGQRVLVIGSGATAMTLVPAMAAKAAHVTMLQRSPTYVISMPDRDYIATGLRMVLPESWAYAITRWKNVALQQFFYRSSRKNPDRAKKFLLKRIRKLLPPDFDFEKHFVPNYNPWDERICLVPNADLFEAIRAEKVNIVTDQMQAFTKHGVKTTSGLEIEADIVVTATGLNLVSGGEAEIEVDGRPCNFADTWSYKGMMYTGVPNLASVFGYVNASWTLRADLIAQFVCRILNRMDETGTCIVQPKLRPEDTTMQPRPWIDTFTPGYLKRSMHLLPKQGDREPWINPQDYAKDRKMFLHGSLDDGVLTFSKENGIDLR